MTRFLLDRDVMSQLDQPDTDRHENVRAWLRSVPDNDLHVSAVTVMEAWKGLTSARRRAAGRPESLHDCDRYERAFETLTAAFDGRIVPIDGPVAKLWGEWLGWKDKNRWDACVAATAIVHDMVVATRNTSDFKGLGARVLDPFHKRPRITLPQG